MGARLPLRLRRGGIKIAGIKCEFCGRAVHSEAALRSHQATLHSQALKERAKQKAATKSSKVQKPELRKVVKKAKPDESVSNVPVDENSSFSDESTNKTVKEKSKTLIAKPKTENDNPKVEKSATKVDKSATKLDKAPINAAKPVTVVRPSTKEATNIEKPISVGKPSTKEVEKKQVKSSIMEAAKKVRKVEYKCPQCDKFFHVQFVAMKHIQKNHPVNSKGEKVAPNSPDIIKPILLELCIYCNKKVTITHMCPNRPDPSRMTYYCLCCQLPYKSNTIFDSHLSDVHSDECISMYFPTEDEFHTWLLDMETQTNCDYVSAGKYGSKHVYRCSNSTDTVSALHVCPSTIFVLKCANGKQVHYYASHYGHEYIHYEPKEKHKKYIITSEVMQKRGEIKVPSSKVKSNDDKSNDLYLEFKRLMESIVLDAAKINIDKLKVLIDIASEMTTVLLEYDEDEEMDNISNRSSLSLNTGKDETEIVVGNPQTRSKRKIVEETNTGQKKLRNNTGDAKVVAKSTGKKPNPSFSLANEKDTDKILKELDSENKADKSLQSPSFNDTFTSFIKKNLKTTKAPSSTPKTAKGPSSTPNKKKQVMKTKMGQFKPSLSPKVSPTAKKEVKRNSIAKDIEYEVREQENDVNILVLKI